MTQSTQPLTLAISWRQSRPLGIHYRGRLLGGVRLPAAGLWFFTWDPIRRASPNRAWRRFATARLMRMLLRVINEHARAHPSGPRLAIGDLSRPRGGDFGPRFGLPGHVSHQNGLDADVYYPRIDGLEQPPETPAEIDRPLAQELVTRFIRAGACRIFVGPRTGLTGPPRIVQPLPNHDNHMHIRIGGCA